jgi:AI-2 transport protein TqsA
MNSVKLPFYAKLALSLLALLLIIFFLMEGSEIFIPLVFALLISVLLFPLNRFLENKLHLGRSVAALLSVIIFIGCIAAFIYFMTLQIVSFSQDLPELQKRVQQILGDLQHWISVKYHINSRQQTDYLNKSATGMLSTAADSIGNIFLSLTGITLWTVFVFIYTYFMLYHRKLLIRFVLHLFNVKNRDQVYEVVMETRGMINSYVLGLLTEMLVLSIVSCTMFMIMGIKYAILLGVMAAVLNIIPYIGIYSAMALAMLVTFANSGTGKAYEVFFGLIGVHLIDSNVLMPRIVGSRVKMNPLITIIAVLVGHFIWGIPGMFLFIPVTGILKLVFERVDGMQAWAILIGVDDNKKVKPTIKGKQ